MSYFNIEYLGTRVCEFADESEFGQGSVLCAEYDGHAVYGCDGSMT
jgi:hypothetical protein